MSDHLEAARKALPLVQTEDDLLATQALALIATAELAERQAVALERIADRLDSWDSDARTEAHELCVRRWS